MANVHRPNEISLFDNFYPIIGLVRPQSAAQWAQKQVTGDYSKDSETPMSTWIISDQTEGIGIKDMIEREHAKRCWWSTAELGYRGHNLLPRLATQAGDNPAGADADILIEYANEEYAVWGTDLRKWNNAISAWSSTLGTLVAVPTHAIVHNDKLYFACGTDFNRYDGTTLMTGALLAGTAQPSRYFAEWDDKLFSLDNTGQLDYSIDEGVIWVANAYSKLPSGYFTNLFVYRNAAGDRAVHMGTKVGLYILNFDTSTWVVVIELPFHSYGCRGAVVWRDESAFISSGLSVYQFIPGSPTIVRPMGPDRDAGLPSKYRGSITRLVADHNAIYAFIDATSEEVRDLFLAGDDEYGDVQMTDNTGSSLILKWNGLGWSTVYVSGSVALSIKGGAVSNANDLYRLWFGIDKKVYYVPLLVSLQNPLEIADYEFAASDEHITPWFDADNAAISKTAAIMTGYFNGMSATEYIKLYYAVDYAETDDDWTLLTNTSFTDGQIDADGETEFTFASGAGLSFKAIRFKMEKVRGTDQTLSPDMIWLRLAYTKNLPLRWGFEVTIDCTRNYRFKSARSLLAALKTAKETGTLGEFNFKDGGSDEAHRVKVFDLQGAEVGGKQSRGRYEVTLLAP